MTRYLFAYLPFFSSVIDPSRSRGSYLVSLPSWNRVREEIMGKTVCFKEEFSLDQRLDESRDILAKYPDRVPVIAERHSGSDLPELEKKKYLVPRDMSVGQFIYILRSRLHLNPGKALFVFVNNTLPQTATLMDLVYESYKEEDGFLYMCYSTEKTFGGTNYSDF